MVTAVQAGAVRPGVPHITEIQPGLPVPQVQQPGLAPGRGAVVIALHQEGAVPHIREVHLQGAVVPLIKGAVPEAGPVVQVTGVLPVRAAEVAVAIQEAALRAGPVVQGQEVLQAAAEGGINIPSKG